MKPSVRHLYIHFPVCARVCPYCAFYVHRGGADMQRSLVQGLIWEVKQAREQMDISSLETIFFGGGTPSLITSESYRELANELPGCAAEFTLEVNPATVTPEKAQAWRAAGTNRISLGAQSFNQEELVMLGRQHRPEDIQDTFRILKEAGFTNINIDLMFGLPGQSLASWDHNLASALACEPQHISAYGLTYEEDTPFFEQLKKGNYKQDEATEIAMFTMTRERLFEAGLTDYEVSNFSRPGFESIHNQAYWLGRDYLGIGPSAVSTIGSWRWINVPDSAAYVEICQPEAQTKSASARWLRLRTELEELSPEIRRKEQLMFGLRMKCGVDERLIGAQYTESVEKLVSQGLLLRAEGFLRLTPSGQLVADSVAQELI